MNPCQHLILDLDGTLLHPEWQPGAVEVPGRTRSSFLSTWVRDALVELIPAFQVILATGRSWKGTEPVYNAFRDWGIPVKGLVMEDGALIGVPGRLRPLINEDQNVTAMAAARNILQGPGLPDFEVQTDFQACVVARAQNRQNASELAAKLTRRIEQELLVLRCNRDGRKVYLLEPSANKWNALFSLLQGAALRAAGIGDGLNDACWLSQIAMPYAPLGSAPEVLEIVAAARGIISSSAGHAGIRELLRHLASRTKEERSGA